MSMPTAQSLPCRHCRADNFEGAQRCWLCGAKDWKPDETTYVKNRAPLPGTNIIPLPATPSMGPLSTDVDVNSWAMMAALGISLFITALGLANDTVGLAVAVCVIWWISIGITILRKGRFQPADVAFTFFRAAFVITITLTLLAAAIIGFFFVVCSLSGPVNFH